MRTSDRPYHQKIEKPLSSLIFDITLPPQLTTTILDTEVGELWISVIDDFERRLVMIKSKSRVKGARDLAEVAEGLRIVVRNDLLLMVSKSAYSCVAGCHKAPNILPGSFPANPEERYN